MWPSYVPKPANGRSYVNPIEVEGDCWLWQWNPSQHAPTVRLGGATVSARRFVYEQERGPLPAHAARLAASCGNPRCVAPDHTVFRKPSALEESLLARLKEQSA